MLKIFDQYKNIIGYIDNYTDLCIESELDTGEKTLSFTHHVQKAEIQNEYYVETQDDRYVVKEIEVTSDGYPEYICQLDLEDLEAEMVESFSAVDVTCEAAANLALAGTGWLVDTDITKVRSVATLKATPLTILEKIKDAWMCEIRYDTKNKVVYFREEFGEDKGVFFTKSLNLRKLQMTGDTYDYYTRIIPIGADDLRITDVNNGVAYVENYQYSDKIRTLIWEDTSYEEAEALLEDAEKKLEDLSKPAKSYEADVVDLARQKTEYSIMDFGLGDTILLLDEETGIKEKQRIVKLKEYPRNPGKNECELSNTTLTFEELQSKLEAAANAFEEITNSDGTVNGYYVYGVSSDGVVTIVTSVGEDGGTTTSTVTLTQALSSINGDISAVSTTVGTLTATVAEITELTATYATIDDLTAANAEIATLNSKYAEIESAIIDEAAIETLISNHAYITLADVNTLLADYATITSLSAAVGRIDTLEANVLTASSAIITDLSAEVANINSVLAGNIGTGTVQTINLTSANVVIADALIEDAMIADLSADKLTAGTIYTDNIKIANNTGENLLIDGSTIQINDGTYIRVQIGEDGTGDYNLYLWDASGNLLWNALGLTEAGVSGNGGIIKDAAVADDAAISGTKLDIASVASSLNEDGSLTVNATQVKIDDTTLDYKISSITSKTDAVAAAAVVSTSTEYYLSSSATEQADGEWTTESPTWTEGTYLWVRTTYFYGDGSCTIGDPVCVTGNTGAAGEDGADGADAVLLMIESSAGNAFKNSSIATTLTVCIIYGDTTIYSSAELESAFGSGAYLTWQCKQMGQSEFTDIPSDDSRLDDNGFIFTLSANDVKTKAVFNCVLNI